MYPLTSRGQFVREFCEEKKKPFPPQQVTLGSVFAKEGQEDRVMEVEGMSTTSATQVMEDMKAARVPPGFHVRREVVEKVHDDTLDLEANPGELFPDQDSFEEDRRERTAELEALEEEALDARGWLPGGGKPWKNRSRPAKSGRGSSKSGRGSKRRRQDHRREAEKCAPMYH